MANLNVVPTHIGIRKVRGEDQSVYLRTTRTQWVEFDGGYYRWKRKDGRRIGDLGFSGSWIRDVREMTPADMLEYREGQLTEADRAVTHHNERQESLRADIADHEVRARTAAVRAKKLRVIIEGLG